MAHRLDFFHTSFLFLLEKENKYDETVMKVYFKDLKKRPLWIEWPILMQKSKLISVDHRVLMLGHLHLRL